MDGNEMTFQSNHLGHFLLTNLLLDKLKESSASRIVNVSSIAHRDANLDLKDLNHTSKDFEDGIEGHFPTFKKYLYKINFVNHNTKFQKSIKAAVAVSKYRVRRDNFHTQTMDNF